MRAKHRVFLGALSLGFLAGAILVRYAFRIVHERNEDAEATIWIRETGRNAPGLREFNVEVDGYIDSRFVFSVRVESLDECVERLSNLDLIVLDEKEVRRIGIDVPAQLPEGIPFLVRSVEPADRTSEESWIGIEAWISPDGETVISRPLIVLRLKVGDYPPETDSMKLRRSAIIVFLSREPKRVTILPNFGI
jgi:hypothetical protein